MSEQNVSEQNVSEQNEKSLSYSCNKTVERDEIISRFIFDHRYCKDGVIRHHIFIPPTNSFEISVYRTKNLSENEIISIDDTYVSGLRGKTSLGRADLKAESIFDLKLEIDPNGDPHPLHADICFSEHMTRDHQKQIALKLADSATFISRLGP